MRHLFLPGLALLGLIGAARTYVEREHTKPAAEAMTSASVDDALNPYAKAILAVQAVAPPEGDRNTCVANASARFHVPPAQIEALAAKWRTQSAREDVFSTINKRLLGELASAGVTAERFVRNECVNINVGALLLSRGYVSATQGVR